MGAPLAKSPPRGLGRSPPTALRIESRMISASDMPRRRAARLIADLSSAGRYTVVLSMTVWYHRWRWHFAQDLLDALGDIAPAASASRGSQELALRAAEVLADRLARDLGDRRACPTGFVAEPQVNFFWQLDRGPLYGMPAYLAGSRRSTVPASGG